MGDNAEEAYRQPAQLLRSMGHIGIEEQRIAWREQIDHIAMPIAHFPLEHIQKLDSLMLEHRKDVGGLRQGNEVGLHDQGAVARMSKKLILMPRPRSPALDFQAFPCPDERRVTHLLEASEQRCYRNLERPRQGLKRRK